MKKRRQNKLFLENITPSPNVAILHLLVYPKTILVDVLAKKVNFIFFRFCPIVKSMISLYKLNTRQFLFINSDIFGQHSDGIETAFATKSDTLTHNLGVLVQDSHHALL